MYESLAGACVALFLAAGRWGFSRLAEGPDPARDHLAEPRLWAVVALAYLALIFLTRRRPLAVHGDLAAEPAWRRLLVCLVSLFGLLAASISWAPDSDSALDKLYEVSLVAACCGCLTLFLAYGDRKTLIGSIWSTLFLFLLLLAAMGLRSVGSERLAVFGGGPNVFGRNMGLLFLCSLDFFERRGRAFVFLPLAAVSIVLVLLSGSRGALFSTCVAAFVYLMFSRIKISKKLAMVAFALCVLLGILSLTGFGSAALERFQHRVLDLTVGQGYAAGREAIADDALEIAARNWLFGSGLAGFRWETGTYPHNLFLEILCDVGLLGVVLLGASLGLVGRQAWRRRQSIDPAILAAFSLFFTFAQFSGDFFDGRAIFVLMLLLASGASLPRDA